MPTTREQLETAVGEMRAYADKCDSKGAALTADERQTLENYSTRVQQLSAHMRSANPSLSDSLKAFDALSEVDPSSPFADLLGDPGAGGKSASAGAGVKPHSFNFSPDQMAELQKSAIDRRTNVKAAITATEAPMAALADYQTEVFPWLREKMRILDLIPTKPTNRREIDYFKATAAAAGAATVAPGGTKPESSPTWTEATSMVRKIAHWTSAQDEVVADFPAFLQLVGQEMLAGLIDEENQQLATGDGLGTNLTGLATDANILTIGSAGTDIDAIAAAWLALKTGAAKCDPTVVIMHPNDWLSTGFLLAKDTAGQYLLGNPVSSPTPRLWGIPVVTTEAMTENTALVANLRLACTAYIRQSPTIEVAPITGATEFKNNTTLIRAEERLALVIHHPKAICSVTAV